MEFTHYIPRLEDACKKLHPVRGDDSVLELFNDPNDIYHQRACELFEKLDKLVDYKLWHIYTLEPDLIEHIEWLVLFMDYLTEICPGFIASRIKG